MKIMFGFLWNFNSLLVNQQITPYNRIMKNWHLILQSSAMLSLTSSNIVDIIAHSPNLMFIMCVFSLSII